MHIPRNQPRQTQCAIDGGVWGDTENHPKNANASSRVGCPVVPPACCVDSAPHTHPMRSDFSSDHPFKYPHRNPASKLSPAPIVSITSTGMEATLTFSPFLTPRAP